MLWGGGAVNPCNIRWSPTEIIYSLKDSTSSILIVDNTFQAVAEQARPDCDTIRQVIYIGDGEPPEGMHNLDALIASARPIGDRLRCNNDLAGVFYTGGTTGFPKGVKLSYQNLMTSALSVVAEGLAPPQSTYLHAPVFIP